MSDESCSIQALLNLCQQSVKIVSYVPAQFEDGTVFTQLKITNIVTEQSASLGNL